MPKSMFTVATTAQSIFPDHSACNSAHAPLCKAQRSGNQPLRQTRNQTIGNQTMPTFQQLATALSRAFVRKTRDNGESFVSLPDGTPEWMIDLVHEAHGDMLPDDWRYRFVEMAADNFAESDD